MQSTPLIPDPRFSRKQFLRLTGAGVAASSLLGTGLTPERNRAVDMPRRGGVLRLGQYADISSFDGSATTLNPDIWTMLLIYDQLVRPTADGLNVEPGLAQSWDISPDGKTYTFHLRRDVAFHDGSPLTADDVKFSVERTASLKNSLWSFLFTALRGIEVVDHSTVRAHLISPHAPFLADLTLYAASIVPKKLVESMGTSRFFQHPIGTGPFMFKSWAKGSEIVLVRNPHYFRAPQPYVDEYHQLLVPDANSRVLQVENGELDVAIYIPPALAASVQSNPAVVVHVDNLFDSHFVAIRTDAIPPLGDKLVRQAMNYAIDKDAIVKHFLFGLGEASGQALPKMFGYSPDIKPYPYDMAMARSLMARSIFAKGFSVTLYVNASLASPDKLVAEYIQQQLKQLNIAVTIHVLDHATFIAKAHAPKYQMNISYMTSDIIDPDELVTFAMAPGGSSGAEWTYYPGAEVDKLATQAGAIQDRRQRLRLYERIDAIHHEEAPMIFLYHSPSLSVSSARLHGFEVLATGNFRLEACWFSS